MSVRDTFSRKTKSVFLKITLTRFTVLFFLLNFIPCIAQGIIQAFLYTDDANAAWLVSTILQVGRVPTTNLPWLTRSNDVYTLRLCNHVPTWNNGTEPCVTVFENGDTSLSNETIPTNFRRSDDLSPIAKDYFQDNGLNMTLVTSQTGDLMGVNMTYNGGEHSVFLDNQCTRVLLYPEQVFTNYRTESLALVGLQFWLFGVSVFALAAQSMPHILASFSMRVLSVGWSSYTIWRTHDVEHRFQHLVSDPLDSACRFDLFKGYIPFRISLQISDLVVSCLALLASGYLSWHLIRTFNEHTFKRVGPPPKVIRAHRYLLAVLVCLHLCLYLTITAMGLWAEQLLHSAIAAISSFKTLYLALFIFVIVTLIPWILLGKHAIRREKKGFMLFFLVLSLTYVVSWSLMFYSEVYRWTWLQWPFFASCTISAFIALIASGVFGVVCWFEFDAGLAHYLYVEELLGKSDFEHDAFKVDTSPGHINSPASAVGRARPLSLLKKDVNWDFLDVETQRPSIFFVDFKDPQRRETPSRTS